MKHPNAAAGGLSGAGLGTLIVFALGKAGVHLEPEAASAIAGATAAAALFVGRNGVAGVWRLIVRGKQV